MSSAVRLAAVCRAIRLAVLVAVPCVFTGIVPASAQQVVAGQNVNMVGGPWSFDPATGKIVGDPFLQRQNEPSLALSSRNACHILAGANDYRAVDVPGLPGDTETGDAWLGLMKSIDCGQTWTSTLLPGYPQDRSAEGLASPLYGLKAGADPTVRSGPAGLIYYSGIAFDRGSKNLGKVFVSRFIDGNNKEQGDPFQYLGTAQIESGTAGQFLDKPWIAADIPRTGATCSVGGQTVPAGNVYIAYTSFTGAQNNPRSKIMFSKSADCGATWSNPTKLSERIAINQGTVLAVSPADGAIYVAWREFANPSDASSRHAILFARSTDGGKTFTKAAAIDSALRPFDQGTTSGSFRSNAYPTMAVDGSGRIYVAWAARGFAAFRPEPATGDARIVMATSSDGGASWSMPRVVVDNYPGPGHQLMPALEFAAGKLAIAYYDFREDLSAVYGPYVDEYQATSVAPYRRHTVDLRAAMAEPADVPSFTSYQTVNDGGSAGISSPSTQVSRYLLGSFGLTRPGLRQVQFNPPNLPIFAQGTVPFMGDYIDIAGQTFTVDADRQWQFNTAGDGGRVPLFHVAWTDNRDVRKPPPGQTWANYLAPKLDAKGDAICEPGTNPGSRNQNVYTAPLMPGLVVTTPGNHKTLGTIQRAFVVFAKNTTSQKRYYTLTLAPPPSGAFASFTAIDESQLSQPGGPAVTGQIGPILIPARSSIARSVFVVAPGQEYPQVTVNVAEVSAASVPTGVSAIAILNPDIANPDIANPDIANPDIANPDIANPDIANPDIANPDIANPDIANGTLTDYKVTDVTWPIKNQGNTTAAYAFRARLKRNLPAGAKYQLIVRRVYIAPQANLENTCGPLLPTIQSQVLVNIPSPDLLQSLADGFDPNEYRDNASFFLQPADRGLVTLRVFCPASATGCPTEAEAARLLSARVISQAPNNCPAGYNAQFPNCAVSDYNPDDVYDAGDTAAPVVSVPANFSVEATSLAGAVVEFSASAQDELSGALTATCSPASGSTFPVGATTVTCSATDTDGNVGSESFTVTVVDTTAPVITVPAGITAEAASAGGAVVTFTATASDGIDGSLAATCTPASGSVFPLGTTTVSCSATDSSGAKGSASFTVTVVDTAAPGVTVPADITAEAAGASGAIVTFTASASDGIDGSLAATCTPASGSVFPIGTTTVSCSATDSSGATGSASFSVTVVDTTAPVVTVPANITAEAAGAGGTTVVFVATALDAVSGPLTPVCAPASGSTFALGPTAVTCGATDAAGRTGTASFTVTIADTTKPVVGGFSFPAGFDPQQWYSAPSITATLNVTDGSSVEVACADPLNGTTVSGLSITVTGDGSHQLTCTVTDEGGNTSQATTTVNLDASGPEVTAPTAVVTAEATGAAGATVTYTFSASDAYSGATITCTPPSGSTFPIGTTSVTCAATDGAGNTATATFAVTVSDTAKPVVSLNGAADVTVEAKSAFTDPGATATDLVSGTLTATVSGTVNTNIVGVYTLTYSATDGSGNTGTATRTVRVVDTSKPVVTLNGSASMTVEAKTTFVDPGATASDTVSGTLAVTVTGTVNTGALGVYTLTYTATDGSGNVGTATRTVTVVDTIKPMVTLNGGATLTVEAGTAFVDPGATATDTLAGPLPVSVSGTVLTGVVGTYTLTYSATDPSGNTGTAVRTVTVRDTLAPSVTITSVIPTTIWSPNGSMVPVTISGTAVDSGSGVATVTFEVIDEYRQVQPSGTVTLAPDGSFSFSVQLQASRKGSDKNGRVYTVRITATDRAGRVTTVSSLITAVEHNQSL